MRIIFHHGVVYSGNLFFTHSLSRAIIGSTISSTSLNLSSSHGIKYPYKTKVQITNLYNVPFTYCDGRSENTRLETERKQVSFPERNALLIPNLFPSQTFERYTFQELLSYTDDEKYIRYLLHSLLY